jgi:hypothetical protein
MEDDDIVEISLDTPVLRDLEGRDALGQSQDDIQSQIQKYAVSSLPAIFQRMLGVALRSKNEKNAIEAAKLIKQFSEGEFREKTIEGQVKKLSDDEIVKKLSGISGDHQ